MVCCGGTWIGCGEQKWGAVFGGTEVLLKLSWHEVQKCIGSLHPCVSHVQHTKAVDRDLDECVCASVCVAACSK